MLVAVTMCNGTLTHLHLQLLPCCAGEPRRSTRLVAAGYPLTDGARLAQRIRAALA